MAHGRSKTEPPPPNLRQAPQRPIDVLLHPIQAFAEHRLAGAGLLLAFAAAAVVWANAGGYESYHHLLEIPIRVGIGDVELEKSLHHWINDGLMGIFFFLVGLEIKRETLTGELSTVRKAVLPAVAAVGGMVVPALLYFAFNPSPPAADGWGIPMATDIAFALGVLALVGDRVPLGLKVFLTALAIVDDIGAVLVIAFFYTDAVSLISLIVGFSLLSASIVANLLHVRNVLVYFLLGTACWLAFLQSGVHATIAAILMAMTIPARSRIDGPAFVDRIGELLAHLRWLGVPSDSHLNDPDQQKTLTEMGKTIERAGAPLQELEHDLAPLVTFVVLPVFALANAGVLFPADPVAAATDPITLGTLAGLVVGKQVGIFGFALLAVKVGWADLPSSVTYRQLWGVSLLGGVGFTMSLFVAGLAFDDAASLASAKLGVLSASSLSAILALLVLLPRGKGASETST